MFTTSCFIRKNTPELRKRLEKFGYVQSQNQLLIPINKFSCLETISELDCYMGMQGLWSTSVIYCGDNEELFLALAALRDDKPDYQWFVWDDIEDEGEKFRQYIPGEPWQDWWWFEVHKATPEELIEYFNGKN